MLTCVQLMLRYRSRETGKLCSWPPILTDMLSPASQCTRIVQIPETGQDCWLVGSVDGFWRAKMFLRVVGQLAEGRWRRVHKLLALTKVGFLVVCVCNRKVFDEHVFDGFAVAKLQQRPVES